MDHQRLRDLAQSDEQMLDQAKCDLEAAALRPIRLINSSSSIRQIKENPIGSAVRS